MPSLVNLSDAQGFYVLSMVEGRDDEVTLDPALSADLLADINRLWGTAVIPRSRTGSSRRSHRTASWPLR